MKRFVSLVILFLSLTGSDMFAAAKRPADNSAGGPTKRPRTHSIASDAARMLSAFFSNLVSQQPASAQSGVNDCDAKVREASLAALPRPYRRYVELQETVADAAALVRQCDEENKAMTFGALLGHPEHQLVTQLPTLCQSYDCLSTENFYGAENLCGYYAAHVAKIFAAHPEATTQEFIDLLNNRDDFESGTFRSRDGKATILQRRQGDPQFDAGDFSNLFGEEIAALLSDEAWECTIIYGYEQDPAQNSEMIEKSESLVRSFEEHRINHLIYIIPTGNRNHWISVLVRREEGGVVRLIAADSLGSDRRSSRYVSEIYRTFYPEAPQAPQAPEASKGQADKNLPGGPADMKSQQQMSEQENAWLLRNASEATLRESKSSDCFVM